MKIESYLKKIKKEYKTTQPSDLFIESGWRNMEMLLGNQEPAFTRRNLHTRMIFVPILILGFFIGIVGVAQSAIPGDILYPVKRLSENVVFKIYPKNEIKTERRAKEIIKLIEEKKSGEPLREAVGDYKKSVEDEKKKIERESEERERFEVRLEKNREEFKKASEINFSNDENKDIEDVLEKVSEDLKEDDRNDNNEDNEGSGSVKGESDKKDNSDSGSHDD